MPYILAILLSLFALSGCNNNESNTPSPLPKLQIQQQTLKNHPTLAGKWTGKWSGQLPSAVVVEEIAGSEATIVYSWGNNPRHNVKEGYKRLKALYFEPKQLISWSMSGGDYRFSLKDNKLSGEVHFPYNDQTFEVSMSKAELNQEDMASSPDNKLVSTPEQHNDGWAVAPISQTPLNPESIQALANDLHSAEYPNTHAVVIAYDGQLIFEQYQSGIDERWGEYLGAVEHKATTLHDMRSVSKSITALLLGTVLDKQDEFILDRPMAELLAIESNNSFTLENTLTMTSGLQWNEMEINYADIKNDERQLSIANDPIAYVFGKSQIQAPGSEWYYNGGLTQLIGKLVEQESNQPLRELAQKNLFEPLQIESFEWVSPSQWPDNMPSAASGLRLTARDLTKIGQLVADNGKWQGKQLVSSGWIERMTQRHVDQIGAWSRGGIWGYGYQWWLGHFENPVTFDVIAAVGNGGQRLYVVPQHKLVVSITAGNYNQYDSYGDEILGRIVEAAVTK